MTKERQYDLEDRLIDSEDPPAGFRKLFDPDSAFVSEKQRAELCLHSGVLADLAAEAFMDLSFFLRASHLDALAGVVKDPSAGKNERFVCSMLIKNAVVASGQVLPLCQDTGTATVMGWKGHQIITDGSDYARLAGGIAKVYRDCNLRYSQLAPLSMFEEKNTGSNMPAQIDIFATEGGEYDFLFMAKGAGSSNKTAFFQKTRALLSPDVLDRFLIRQIAELGADACPPYHIAVVIGGSSPEHNLKMQKLAPSGWLDGLPDSGNMDGRAFRDPVWEERVMQIAAETPVGAQFGGGNMALSARVIRLSRHGGSCPVSVGVSCNAHRNIRAKISRKGVFLEQLDKNPSRLLDVVEGMPGPDAVRIELDCSIEDVLAQLHGLKPGALLLLNGPLTVARDLVHAELYEKIRSGGRMPEYMKKHPVCYAGPARRPAGRVIGSIGPTTSRRMDSWQEFFMKEGASLISIGKGSRSPRMKRWCREYGGFYLGTVGGAAALIAEEHIISCDIIDYPDFGMEAVYSIKVRDLPAFIIYDDRGESFYP